MAQFEGTSEEFIKFIGGYTRNKVQILTRTYRRSKGKCELCGRRTKKLDAAHIRGKERPVITSNILNNFIQDGIINIDLHNFEDQFCQAHYPLEDSIIILCKECHQKYDRPEMSTISVIDEHIDDIDIEKIDQQEIKIVSDLIINSKMNKSKALDFIKDKITFGIDTKSVIYSNVNSAIDVYWLEPSNDKFKNGFHIILNNSNERKLFLFKIPENIIVSPENIFEQRSEKGVSKIIIKVSDVDFIDKKGFKFTPYLIKIIEY